MRVLVTHPGRQHSHQAALALERAGMLAGYWAGVPVRADAGYPLPRRLWRRLVRYQPLPLPRELGRWFPWTPVLRRLGDALLPARANFHADYAACRLFDRWVARRLGEVAADALLACEISARDSFRRAKARGWMTLLDAPSIHHRAQDRLHGFREPAALHRRITAVKDEEIALADTIVTVSELARATYLEAGVAPEKVIAVPLGADLELFAQPRAERTGRPIRFLFAGALIRRKGFDLALAAFEAVRAEVPAAEMVVVGPPGEEAAGLARVPGGVSYLGSLPQAELARLLATVDCLVLPSRNDSYGMVVAEALAAGVPVIASAMVGAKELIEPGKNGWVVPLEDLAATSAVMRSAALAPDAVRALAPACREAARGATWAAYGERFVAALGTRGGVHR